MTIEGVRMMIDTKLTMLLSYEGELTIGSLVVGRDSSGDMLEAVCRQLGVPMKEYIQIGCDSDKGIHLQVTETECLTQLGSFGIMQNKDRVLYGNIEDDEFVKSAAVYDKKSKQWAAEVAGTMVVVDTTKALSNINRIIKDACIDVMGNSNISKPSYVDDTMQGKPIDITPSPLLHFPPSFFCSTVDSDSAHLVDKLQEIDRLVKNTLNSDSQLDNRFTTDSFADNPQASAGKGIIKPIFARSDSKGPRKSETSSGISFQFKKQRKPKTLMVINKTGQSKGKKPVVISRLDEDWGKEQTASDRFKSTVDTSDRQKLTNLSEERLSQVTECRRSNSTATKKSHGGIQNSSKPSEVVKVGNFLERKVNNDAHQQEINVKFDINPQGIDLKKQASEPKFSKLPQDNLSKRSGSITSSVRSIKRPISSSTNRERLSNASSEINTKMHSKPLTAASRDKRAKTLVQQTSLESKVSEKLIDNIKILPGSNLAQENESVESLRNEGVSELVKKMENKIDDLVKDIISMSADDFIKIKKTVKNLKTPKQEKVVKGIHDKLSKGPKITFNSSPFESPNEKPSAVFILGTSRTSSLRTSLKSVGQGLSTHEAKHAQLSQSPLSVKSNRPRSTVVFEKKTIESEWQMCVTEIWYNSVQNRLNTEALTDDSFSQAGRNEMKVTLKKAQKEAKVEQNYASEADSFADMKESIELTISQTKPVKEATLKVEKAKKVTTKAKKLIKKKSELSELSQEHEGFSVGLGRLKIPKDNVEQYIQQKSYNAKSKKEVLSKPAVVSIPASKIEIKVESKVQPALNQEEPVTLKVAKPARSLPPRPVKNLDKSTDQLEDSLIQSTRIANLQQRAKDVIDRYRTSSSKPLFDLKKSVKWSEDVDVKEITPLPDSRRSKISDKSVSIKFNFTTQHAIDQHLAGLGVQKSITPVRMRMAITSKGIDIRPLASDRWLEVPFSRIPVDQNPIMYRFLLSMDGIGLKSISDRFACIASVYPYELFVMLDTIIRG